MLKAVAGSKIRTDVGQVSEIFSSIQGEGLRVGEKHLFVRFRSCNIACDYCDEHDKLEYQEFSVTEVLGRLQNLERESGPHEFVSLTGGEPLVYHNFLAALVPVLGRAGFRIYLETNGILTRALETVVDVCDMIAMDIKLPSVTKEREFFREHEEFLKVAVRKPVFVKMVISKEMAFPEFCVAVDLVARVDRNIPLVLQPKMSGEDRRLEPGIGPLLSSLVSAARRQLNVVRIIPQTHVWLHLR